MNILITGAWRASERCLCELEGMGHTLAFMPDERGDLPCSPAWAEGVICNGLFLYHPIQDFTSLSYVQLTSAGYDRMPVAYAAEKGITLYNARGVYSIPMAEFALAAVLALYKQTGHFGTAQAAHRWDKHRGLREIFGKRVCILGCGSVGTECAKRFAAMGCRITGVDAFPRADEHFEAMVGVEALSEALPAADILILTLPLTPETRHILGKRELALLPEGCVLVNIARGGVLDTEALIEVLKTRDVSAALDVFEEEPLRADSPLWELPNVLLTPHNSFVGEGNAERLWQVIRSNLLSHTP